MSCGNIRRKDHDTVRSMQCSKNLLCMLRTNKYKYKYKKGYGALWRVVGTQSAATKKSLKLLDS